MQREIDFMRNAIEIGRQGMLHNEGGPFGCVIVKDNVIVGKGCNKVIVNNDPTAHAEITAIRDACKNLGTFQLADCEIYTSCEPCPMCMGAIYWARPGKVYFAANRNDAAAVGFDDSLIYEELSLPLDKRKIAIECVGRKEAQEMFKEWTDKIDRTLY